MIDFERTWWIVVSCVVTTCLGYVLAEIRNRIHEAHTTGREASAHEVKQTEALRYLLKSRLTDTCDKWLAKGYLPNSNRELVIELRDIYHDLGGNSYISALTDKVLALPHKKKGGKHGKH